MNLGRAAILGALLITAATWTAAARADVVNVLAATRPPWLGDLVHEMETAGFDARVGGPPGDGRWALRLTLAPDAIDVLGRAAGGRNWIVSERLTLGRTVEARRRAIVRAVEILRARRFSAAAAARETSEPLAAVAPEPGRAVAPATVVEPAPTVAAVSTVAPARAAQDQKPPPVAAAEIARPVVERTVLPTGPTSLGIASSVGGAVGGLGSVVGLGLVGRWTGHHLSLWSRAEAAISSTTVSGAEGSAAIRSAALSLGVGWSPRDASTARWNPVLGGEATGLLVRAVGEGGPGYRGQTIVVPGLSAGGVVGIRFRLTRHLETSVQARAGIVAWEPIVRFAGRRVAAWQGAMFATTAELAWRF